MQGRDEETGAVLVGDEPALEFRQKDFRTIYGIGLFDQVWYAARYPDGYRNSSSRLEQYVE